MLAIDDQTIVSQCTPQGTGAIALLRLSGLQAIQIADTVARLPHNKRLINFASHTIHYGWIVNSSGISIDQVMFLLMRTPKTFTGQDTVEITCHNNQFLIQEIINVLIQQGARPAQAGEFTKRAVLNNKLDLIQAEAINELIGASTQQALKQSLAQLKGSFSQWIHTVENDLIKALAFSEASFEFVEEEVEFGQQIKEIIKNIFSKINLIKIQFDQQRQIRQGIRVAFIGSVNAGKSSLFNALLEQERAIVTSIAGTTRDSIECGISVDDTFWTLVDTAGLRQASNTVEKKGIQRSFEEAEKADIVLLVFDSSRSLSSKEYTVYHTLLKKYKHKIIIIPNKSDLTIVPLPSEFQVQQIVPTSSKTKKNIEAVKDAIKEKNKDLFKQQNSPFLLNQRQFNLMLLLEKELHHVKQMLQFNIQYELLSYHLREALSHLTELTGKTISEQAMNALFKEFCIGK